MPVFKTSETIIFGKSKVHLLEGRVRKILEEVRPFYGDGTRDATEYLQLCVDLGVELVGKSMENYNNEQA